jgi:hypothetical protein
VSFSINPSTFAASCKGMSAAAVFAFAGAAGAVPVVSSFTSPAVFFGQTHSLGYQFVANTALQVNSLGYYDSGLDGLVGNHSVGIYSAGGALLGSAVVGPTATTLLGDFRYVNLGSPINLAAGATYYIAGTVGGNADGWVYQAANIITSGINYTGSYYAASVTTLTFPVSPGTGREYMTVNFNAVPVAEPQIYALMLAGRGIVGLVGHRRRVR